MRLDILEALRRAITLPAARNSLSDLLGSSDPALKAAAIAVTTTIHDVLADAIASGVHILSTTTTTDQAAAQQLLSDQVTHALSGVSPELAVEIKAVVAAEVKSLDALAQANIVATSNALLAAVAKLLHTA